MNSLPAQIFADVGQAQDRLVSRAWGAALDARADDPRADDLRPTRCEEEPTRMRPRSHGTGDQRGPGEAGAGADGSRDEASTARRSRASRAQPAKRPSCDRPARVRRRPERLLRRPARREGARHRVLAERGDGDHRPVGLRQVDDGALHQPDARGGARRARDRQDHARRHRHLRRRRGRGDACAGPSAWCSRSRTRSRRCRCSTTSPRACGCSGIARRQAARPRGADAARRRACGTR